MAKSELEENNVIDKKAAKRAAKMKKKEEKKLKKNAQNQEEEEEGGKVLIVFVTIIIVIIWLGILALLVKLDVGGFGSTVLYPILKDVPYVNMILPETEEEIVDVQYPYATLDEAVDRIKELEVELSDALKAAQEDDELLEQQQAEIIRLQEFENEQAAFQELKTKFYQEVVFSENAPDINEYRTYYESIDEANAAALYKQVVQQLENNQALEEYAATYAAMKPKDAAAIMEEMTDDLKLVAEILEYMDAESRGNILAAMDSKIAAQVTRLMEP